MLLRTKEIVTIDIATGGKKTHADMDTEPLCAGPDGWFYYFSYGQGMKWYASDENGMVVDIK